jgi:AhpC/TSA family.
MRKIFYALYICSLFALLTQGCGGRQRNQLPTTAIQKVFPAPEVPSILTTPEQHLGFLLAHYWDNFNFADSVEVKEKYVAEAFANYASMLYYAQAPEAQKSLVQFLQKAALHDTTFLHFISLADTFIYNPNAPYHHDENYLFLIEQVIDAPAIPAKLLPELRYRREMLSKNRVGTPATDFSFETLEGTKHLYDYHNPLTILYFYNPGCHSCEALSQRLAAMPALQDALTKKEIALLSVCVDADTQTWIQNRKHPEHWIDGYDRTGRLSSQRLYDLKAIPCLYLLGPKHEILLKDPTFEGMIQRIFQ